MSLPPDSRGLRGATTNPDGTVPSEQGRDTADDRGEGGHEAERRGCNRAHQTGQPVSVSAHRLRRPPSPTDLSLPRSQAHHPSPPTSILPDSQSPLNAASSSSSHQQPNMFTRQLLDLLQCPLCTPSSLLHAPITLHCGHTFCASHFISPDKPSTSTAPDTAHVLPQCPLPTCCPSSPRLSQSFSRTAPVDVTTNKLLGLLLSASLEVIQPDSHPLLDDRDDRTDSEPDEPTELEHEYDSHSDLEYLPLNPQPPPLSAARDTDQAHTGSASSRRPRPSPEASPQLHPRKRRRRLGRRSTGSSQMQPRPYAHDRRRKLEKELLSELKCEICFGLFLQPVTTPCQHTFCTRCLFRSLDHNSTCPLCRQTLPGYDYFQQHPCNKVILAIILNAFPEAYAERRQSVEAEERDDRLNTPIFVCQLSFPGIPTILHFFEPRYRLMLRRCLEDPNPCFGMIPPPRDAPSTSANGNVSTGNDYGTMLQIRSVQMMPDGRSVVETWGTWRFRIMERGLRDGYMVARVERIEDYEDELDSSALPSPDEGNSGGDRAPVDAVGTSVAALDFQELEDSQLGGTRAAEGDQDGGRADIGDVLVDIATVEPQLSSPSSSSDVSRPRQVRVGVDAGAIASSSSHPADQLSTAARTSTGSLNGNGKTPAAPAAHRPPTNAELVAKCHEFIEQTRRRGVPWMVELLNKNYVPMPNDTATFSFWMALLLPIDQQEKAKLLPIRSPRLRLRLVVHWIDQLNNQWARAYASASALQVVLSRLRCVMNRPQWVMFLAYVVLLTAVYVAQAVSRPHWTLDDHDGLAGDS